MVDYYTELEISQSLGLDEIKQALVRLSKVYEKREADGFDAAKKKLVLIREAETVFKTESTRQRYDRELSESKNAPTSHADPMEERKAQYKQWFGRASEYYQSGQYDAAKKAIDRAFRNVSPNDDDADLYGLAAEIYRMNGELKAALDYVIEALVLDEENASYHITKFQIYEGLENSSYSDRANYNLQKRREILTIAERYAEKSGDSVDMARVYDLLAHVWYDNGRGDIKKAMAYAVSATQLFPDAVNALYVLESIEQARQAEAKREQQQRNADEAKRNQQQEIDEQPIRQKKFEKLSVLAKATAVALMKRTKYDVDERMGDAHYSAGIRGSVMHHIQGWLLASFTGGYEEADGRCFFNRRRIILNPSGEIENWYTGTINRNIGGSIFPEEYARKDSFSFEDIRYFDFENHDWLYTREEKEGLGVYEGNSIYEFIRNSLNDSRFVVEGSNKALLDRYYQKGRFVPDLPLGEGLRKALSNLAQKHSVVPNTNIPEAKIATSNKSKKMIIILTAIASVIAVGFVILYLTVLVPQARFNTIMAIYDEGRFQEAAELFYADVGNQQSSSMAHRARRSWFMAEIDPILSKSVYVSAAGWNPGDAIIVGLLPDGTVVAAGDNRSERNAVSGWTNIVGIATGTMHTVGLRADGTVVATGQNWGGQLDVSSWRDVVAIAADNHTVGLRADGTVVTTFDDSISQWGQIPMSEWYDISAIATAGRCTIGLRNDGTIIIAGSIYAVDGVVAWGIIGEAARRAMEWEDIIAISAGEFHLVGLKVDGTVVATGGNHNNQIDVDDWSNITAILAGQNYTVGLRADGTVVATGGIPYGGSEPVFMRGLAERIILNNEAGR